jgi:hypothetical protein
MMAVAAVACYGQDVLSRSAQRAADAVDPLGSVQGSSLMLEPCPSALTDGLAESQKIIERWAGCPSEER